MNRSVIVIGAGASGMTAAIFAARQGAGVTLLEHTQRVGKKLLSTGNGRCNLTNRRMEESCYRSGHAAFPMEVLSQFGVKQTIAFFEGLGIVLKDRDGYLYPYSGQASSVLDVLRLELTKQGVNVVTECDVKEIVSQDGNLREYRVVTSNREYRAAAVILATGSKAAPVTGSDGSGYALAKALGLQIVKPLPALVPLRCKETFYKQITGIRTDGAVALFAADRKIAEDRGELQLTDYGISGIPVFQVSRFASKALDEGKKVTAVIDFYPEQSRETTELLLMKRYRRGAEKLMEDFLTGWFHKKLAALFLKLAGIDSSRFVKTLSVKEKEKLLSLIKEFKTEVTAVNPFAGAQVCCGGVDAAQVNPMTMESKKKKGLYLAGELLDVDGICGGYNLQWAWSTGAIAGTHAGMQYDKD